MGFFVFYTNMSHLILQFFQSMNFANQIIIPVEI